MLKKTFFILMLVIFSGVLFAQWGIGEVYQESVYTSDGIYSCTISYEGKNKGEQRISDFPKLNFLNKLTNGQLEAINKMLVKYKYTAGDTYTIILGYALPYGHDFVAVIVEFTSNTHYKWWALR